jgi:hypothetical protein
VLEGHLNTGSVLLWDAFNDGDLQDWTIIGEGKIGGPSE